MQFSLYSEDSSRTYFYNKQICNDAKRKISYESYIEKKRKGTNESRLENWGNKQVKTQ